jgi:hypothetical protein
VRAQRDAEEAGGAAGLAPDAQRVQQRRTDTAPAGPPLRVYAEAMAALAAVEVSSISSGNRSELAESAIVGMVLYERVLIAVHRLAQEDASAAVFAHG